MSQRVVNYAFRADFAQFQSGLAAMGRGVNDLGTKLTALDRNGAQMRRGLDTLGQSAGRVSLVAAAGLAGATKAAIDWESAWAGVMKTTEGTAAQMAELEGQLRELARTMPATHEEIAATAEAAGQLGVARQDIAAFTETMIQLGATTNLTADQAATSIAQIANVMGTAPGDIDNLGAALVDLGNNGASTEAQILEMAQRIAGTGAQIGLAESDILGIANAVASMGIEAEAGGTAVSTAFTKMAMAVSSGGPKLEQFAEIAGVSATEFQRMFKETPAEAFAAFAGGLDRISKSGGDVFSALKSIGLSDIRVSQALLGLAASGDLLNESLDRGAAAWQENSALANEFAKRSDTTAAEVQVAWNNIKDAAIDFGAAALPVVSKVADSVSGLAGALNALPGPLQTTAAGMLGITAVLGGGLWFTSKVASGIANTREALDQLGESAPRVRTGLVGIGKGFAVVGALQAIGLVSNALDDFGDSLHGIGAGDTTPSELANELNGLVNGSDGKKLSVGLSDLGANLDHLGSTLVKLTGLPGAAQIDDALSGVASLWGGSTQRGGVEDLKEFASALDAALVQIAQTDGVARAKAALDAYAESENLTADQTDSLTGLLTGLREEVAKNAPQVETLSDGSKVLAGSLEAAGDAATESAEKVSELEKSARETGEAFFGLGDKVDDSKVSLNEWIADLRNQAKALEEFTENARTAGDRGLSEGLIAELEAAGPAGALRMRELADGTDLEIRRANRAWARGEAAIESYINLKVPPKTLTIQDRAALMSIDKVRLALFGLKDKTVKVTVQRGGTLGNVLGLNNDGTYDKDRNPKTGNGKAFGGPIHGFATADPTNLPAALGHAI